MYNKTMKITLEEIEKRVFQIEERNKRVEKDKAWETSKTRTAFISFITFLLIFVFMKSINAERPLLNSLIAVAAYWLSTQSYGLLKSWWLDKRRK